MSRSNLTAVLRHAAALAPPGGDAPDSDLLARFRRDRDGAAFAALVARHGRLVWATCRRLLPAEADAEDAFQAVFLALARSAGAVRDGRRLGGWLHAAAVRVCANARRAAARRARRERAAAGPEAGRAVPDAAWGAALAAVHEEVARLPDALRAAFVVCELEGVGAAEAAGRLGWPVGTLTGRLCRARARLLARLGARGLAPALALAAAATPAAAGPPPALAGRAAGLADPSAAVPAPVSALTHEFLKGVAMTKLKLLTAGLAGVLVLAVGVGSAQQPVRPPAVAVPDGGTVQLGGTNTYTGAGDTDEAFIRRVSRDLRGTEPTPAEAHFFLASKDANRRTVLVDLFVKERAARTDAGVRADEAKTALADAERRVRAAQEQEMRATLMARQAADLIQRLADKGLAPAERTRHAKMAEDIAAELRALAPAQKGAGQDDRARQLAILEAELRAAAQKALSAVPPPLAEARARADAERRRADAERAAAEERAAYAERMATKGYQLSQAQAQSERDTAAAAARRALEERDRALAELAALVARQQAEAEKAARDAAKQPEKGVREPGGPTVKGFRQPVDPRGQAAPDDTAVRRRRRRPRPRPGSRACRPEPSRPRPRPTRPPGRTRRPHRPRCRRRSASARRPRSDRRPRCRRPSPRPRPPRPQPRRRTSRCSASGSSWPSWLCGRRRSPSGRWRTR